MLGTKLPQLALLLEQGAGKTLPMISILGYRFLRGDITKALVVCPLSVAPELEMQFEEFAGYPVEVTVLAGLKSKKKAKAFSELKSSPGKLQVIIINYESVWVKGRRGRRWEVHPGLLKWAPQAIWCDESQKLKDGASNQCRALTKLGSLAKYRGIMTGTVISESPLDFFGQYKFLDPSIFGTSFSKFKNKYARLGGYRGYQVIGYQNLEDLTQKALRIAYRVKKRDCIDLPPITTQTLYAELEPEAMKLYKEMKKESLLELDGKTITAPLVITRNLKLSQITGGYITYYEDEVKKVRQVSKAKLAVTMDKVKDLVYNKSKVIIFAKFIPEIEGITRELDKAKIKYSTLTGKVKDRKSVLKDFQHPLSKTKVIVVQIATGGVGITLTAADVALYYSVDYSNINYEQSKARIDRIGQKKKMSIIHVVAKGTIDSKVIKALIEKQSVSNALLNDYFEEIGGKPKMERFKQEDFEIELPKRVLKLSFPQGVESKRPAVVKETATLGELESLLKEMEHELNNPMSPADAQNLWDSLEDDPSKKKTKKQQRAEKKPKEGGTKRESKPRLDGDVTTLKELAESFGMEPKELRKELRKKYGSTESGRWEWLKDDPQLKDIKKEYEK